MATLSNRTLTIDPITGTTNYRVTAKVRVEFTPTELYWMNPNREGDGVPVKLKSTLWGQDVGEDALLGGNDILFLFPDRKITRSATYTFSTVVSGSVLNEDVGKLPQQDEIYNRFSLVSKDPDKIPNSLRNSPVIKGYYGPFE